MLRGGHLKHVGDGEEGLLGLPVADHLQNREVLQDAVHHVLLWQVFQLQDEVDHVLAHGTALDLEQISPILKARTLRLYLLHHLFTEAADLGGALYVDILRALIPAMPMKMKDWSRLEPSVWVVMSVLADVMTVFMSVI